MAGRTLYVIACAAGPIGELPGFLRRAQAEGWECYVVATPAAVAFLDLAEITGRLGVPVFSEYRRPEEPKRQPPADAAVIPAGTYNTVNKWAAGIADNYALGTLAELTGKGVPVVLQPSVNELLAANRVYRRSLHELEVAGVTVVDSWEAALAALPTATD
jgi:phosphopantothenoylcysteine synthetase/decarboxylase